jgi:hypothetical protein
MRWRSFERWRSRKFPPGTWRPSFPKRDEIRPIVDRWRRAVQRREVVDVMYLAALALVLVFAAYLILTG